MKTPGLTLPTPTWFLSGHHVATGGVMVGWPYCPTWTMWGFVLNVNNSNDEVLPL
jgi:hypothetical protein